MGAVSFSIDLKIVEFLKGLLGLNIFIETGTFHGDTVERVVPYFKNCFSIELSKEYYNVASERFKNNEKVTILEGDSSLILSDLMEQLSNESVLFWLDAHWCADENTKGKTSQCPLLRELKAISYLNDNSVILIDDARLYLCAPGKPHEYSQWPDINEIWIALQNLSNNHEIMIINDIILFYPHHIREKVKIFSHEYAVDWLDIMNTSRDHERIVRMCDQFHKDIEKITHEKESLFQKYHSIEQKKESLLKRISEQKKQLENFKKELHKSCTELNAINEKKNVLLHNEAEKQTLIDSQHNELNKKSAEIFDYKKQVEYCQKLAESRLHIIEERDNVIKKLESRRIMKRLILWLFSDIKKLNHIKNYFRKIFYKFF